MTQFYAMDVSVQDATRVNAGSQDNGSLRSWASTNIVTGDWNGYVGGDGMMNRIDPTNDRKFYGCSQNGGCRGFAPSAPANGFGMTIPGARKNWVAPLEFAADPRYCSAPARTSTGWTRSPPSAAHVEADQHDLTEGPMPRAPGFGTITALGTTTADPNLVYAGTDSGLMWVSRNAMAAVRRGDVDRSSRARSSPAAGSPASPSTRTTRRSRGRASRAGARVTATRTS